MIQRCAIAALFVVSLCAASRAAEPKTEYYAQPRILLAFDDDRVYEAVRSAGTWRFSPPLTTKHLSALGVVNQTALYATCDALLAADLRSDVPVMVPLLHWPSLPSRARHTLISIRRGAAGGIEVLIATNGEEAKRVALSAADLKDKSQLDAKLRAPLAAALGVGVGDIMKPLARTVMSARLPTSVADWLKSVRSETGYASTAYGRAGDRGILEVEVMPHAALSRDAAPHVPLDLPAAFLAGLVVRPALRGFGSVLRRRRRRAAALAPVGPGGDQAEADSPSEPPSGPVEPMVPSNGPQPSYVVEWITIPWKGSMTNAGVVSDASGPMSEPDARAFIGAVVEKLTEAACLYDEYLDVQGRPYRFRLLSDPAIGAGREKPEALVAVGERLTNDERRGRSQELAMEAARAYRAVATAGSKLPPTDRRASNYANETAKVLAWLKELPAQIGRLQSDSDMLAQTRTELDGARRDKADMASMMATLDAKCRTLVDDNDRYRRRLRLAEEQGSVVGELATLGLAAEHFGSAVRATSAWNEPDASSALAFLGYYSFTWLSVAAATGNAPLAAAMLVNLERITERLAEEPWFAETAAALRALNPSRVPRRSELRDAPGDPSQIGPYQRALHRILMLRRIDLGPFHYGVSADGEALTAR